MRPQLHILTKRPDALADEVLGRLKLEPGANLEIFDLTGDKPDYGNLLKQIFAAESVVVW